MTAKRTIEEQQARFAELTDALEASPEAEALREALRSFHGKYKEVTRAFYAEQGDAASTGYTQETTYRNGRRVPNAREENVREVAGRLLEYFCAPWQIYDASEPRASTKHREAAAVKKQREPTGTVAELRDQVIEQINADPSHDTVASRSEEASDDT